MLLHVVLVTTATALAIAAARLRGATARSTLLVVSACLLVAPWSWTLRAQAFALPLFVATLALLASDRDLLRRRTLLVFPLLVVWANVHGSVVVGAAIAAWAGAIGLGELALRRPHARHDRGAAARSSCCRGCASSRPRTAPPSPRYYKLMFVDSPVAKAVTEWQAPRPHGYQLAFFVVARGDRRDRAPRAPTAVALRPRRAGAHTRRIAAERARDRLVRARRVGAPAGGARRDPSARPGADPPPGRARALRRLLRRCSGRRSPSGSRAATAGTRATGRAARARAVAAALPGLPPGPAVLPSDRHADWLLWKVPALRGRIAYDIRFELLTDRGAATRWRCFKAVRPGWLRGDRGYPIVVLDTDGGSAKDRRPTSARNGRSLPRRRNRRCRPRGK